MIIKENEIHIYQSSLDTPLISSDSLKKLLSQDEIDRAQRFKFEKLRTHFITGRGILRIILGNYLNQTPESIKFSYADKGKPFIKDSSLKFNLAHSGGRVVYAFTEENEVGIDLEIIKEMKDASEIAKHYFSRSEIEDLEKVGEDNINKAFFNCWTSKEAFIKTIGDGLSYPLANFSVTLKPGEKPKILWIKDKTDEVNHWSLFRINTEENYISTLAIKAKEAEIIYRSPGDGIVK